MTVTLSCYGCNFFLTLPFQFPCVCCNRNIFAPEKIDRYYNKQIIVIDDIRHKMKLNIKYGKYTHMK